MTTEDATNITFLLKQLESPSSAVVYRGLHDVRYKLLSTTEGVQLFKQNNGFKYLLRFVKKPNEKILDLTLSILANLCLEESFRTEVADENGLLSHLVSLVAHMQKDSIVGRACRLIGNLATSPPIAIKLHQRGAVPKLIKSIKSEESSPGTKHMAVRALRLLWEAETNRPKMLQDLVIQTVASLLTTPVDELLQAVLKALSTFTHHCNEQCAVQIQGDGKGFEDLVACIKLCSKSELAICVLLNLCSVPEVRPLLGTAGIVEAVVDLLNGIDPHQYSSVTLSVLCLLCRESVNRSKVRRCGGLEVLLNAIRCEGHAKLEARILNALLHFIYDETGLELQIKEGLVPVLVQKLHKGVNNRGDGHKSPVFGSSSSSPCKRIRLLTAKGETVSHSCSSASDPLGLRTRDMALTSSRPDIMLGGQWSPGSSMSVEFSPDASRTYSPSSLGASHSPTLSALSPSSTSPPPSPQSDAYSPVCGYSSSEDERPDDPDAETVGECDPNSDCEVTSPCLIDKDDIEDIQEALAVSLPSNSTSRHGAIENFCLLLLSRISHMDILVDDMVSSNTVDTLLQYYTLIEPPHPRAARVLLRIARNPLCLIPLLRAGLVVKVNKRLMRLHDDCLRCMDYEWLSDSLFSQLAMLAESGFGEGEILHHLMCATRAVQALIIVSIPFIVRSKRLHKLFMLHSKINNESGLDLLWQLATNECGDGLSSEAIDSIWYLAREMGVSSDDKPEKLKLCKRKNICSTNGLQISEDGNDDIVTLELDNGSTVRARRRELCQESPMFSAMLTGGFRESGSECISLKDVTDECMSVLLALLHTPSQCICCLQSKDIDFAFQILKLADRFMLSKVIDKVSHWLVSQLTPEVISSMYVQAANLHHVSLVSKEISKQTLRFALGTSVDRKKRIEIFSAIFDSGHKRQFIDDITGMIKNNFENPSQFNFS